MTPFLKYVAQDLFGKLGRDMSQLVVVFPNKRASLFLNEYIASCCACSEASPIWIPQYQTINELFASMSPLTVADKIETVCRIHKIYLEETGNSETLDFFYGWGERLLADFDDIDKNMADADKLFRNIRDIKKIDEIGSLLGDAQEQALSKFFSDFSVDANSKLKGKYLELWNALGAIYHKLNQQMKESCLAYEGAQFRSVVEMLQEKGLPEPLAAKQYAFVGFNVLDKVESALFSLLGEQGRAWFYWDYDVFYTEQNQGFEAGTFLRSNLKLFPNQLPQEYFDNFRHTKQVEFLAASTENAQVHALAPWLEQNLSADEKETAVVLCNEALIEPVLHAIPPSVKEANITKGYPVRHTVAHQVLEKSMEEVTDGAKSNVGWLEETMDLLHKMASEQRQGETPLERTLNTEAFFLVYTALNRFRRLISEGWLDLERATLFRLVRQAVAPLSVPFHGEPAAGLQIMGVLETRCLDFKNVIMLSVSEGFLPGTMKDNSFIPYNLRLEFGLTTTRHKVAVYAYYFYRLLQRAEKICLVYNASPSAGGAGEMSRFMTQLLVESPLVVTHHSMDFNLQSRQIFPQPIAKPVAWAEGMRRFSPSAINEYMRCQLLFFYNRVAKIKAPQKQAVIIEPNVLGSVFHKTAELFYLDFVEHGNPVITPARLAPFLEPAADASLVFYVRRAMAEEQVGENVLVEQIVKSFFKQLLRNDSKLATFKIKGLETPRALTFNVLVNGAVRQVELCGIIDRMDIVSDPTINDGAETLRIVDYKTNGSMEQALSMDALFTPGEKHPHYVLQTFLYALMVAPDVNNMPLMPTLFFVNKYGDKNFLPYIKYANEPLTDFAPLAQDFKFRLEKLLSEMLDEATPFKPTSVLQRCENCNYRLLCYGK